jgi:NTP pyrophosphatase (non-canonical NTP hydrolase)
MTKTLKEWGQEIWANAVAKGAYDTDGVYDINTPGGKSIFLQTKLGLIHSEVSEALEEVRKGPEHYAPYYNVDSDKPTKPEGMAVELIDAVIRTMDLLHWMGYDIETILKLKHEYNLTRPYKHNKKFI